MRIKRNINWGLLIDPITNSQNQNHTNCMAVTEENY